MSSRVARRSSSPRTRAWLRSANRGRLRGHIAVQAVVALGQKRSQDFELRATADAQEHDVVDQAVPFLFGAQGKRWHGGAGKTIAERAKEVGAGQDIFSAPLTIHHDYVLPRLSAP